MTTCVQNERPRVSHSPRLLLLPLTSPRVPGRKGVRPRGTSQDCEGSLYLFNQLGSPVVDILYVLLKKEDPTLKVSYHNVSLNDKEWKQKLPLHSNESLTLRNRKKTEVFKTMEHGIFGSRGFES